MIEPVAIGPDELLRRKREIERLWNEVWPGTPRERFDEILPRHARRDGFRAVVADDEEGRLVGLAYGYAGAPGEWWHDVVSTAMGEEAAARWLGVGHFELVELMVGADARGHGLGGRLHDAIVAGLQATAVLSTHVDNEPALALYRGRGWKVVVPEVQFAREGEGERYCVLCIDLREAKDT